MATSIGFDIFARDNGASATLNKVGDAADRGSSKFAKMAEAGKRTAQQLAFGILGAGAAAIKLAQGAADDEQAAAKMAQTFRNAAGATNEQIASTENWISKMGVAYGVADDDLRPALSRLVTATGDVGQAQKLAALAMDVSAGTGKSLESVSTALMKAQNGQVSSLSRLGIKTKDAEGNTLSFKQAVASMSETFKGQAAKSADTAAGKFQRLKVAFSEAGETIGYKILPPLTRFGTWLVDKGIPAGSQFAQTFGTILTPILRTFGNIVSTVFAAANNHLTTAKVVVGGVVGAFLAWKVATLAAAAAQGVMTVATTAWSAATKIAAVGQWALNAAMDANPIGLVVIAIAALVGGLVLAYKKSETFRNIVNGAFGAVKSAASAVASFITKKIPAAFSAIIGWVKSHWPIIAAIIMGPFGIAVLAIARNWDRIKAGAANVKDFIIDRFNAVIGFFRSMPGRIASAAANAFNGLKSAFIGAVNFIIGKWNGLSFSLPSVDTHIPGVGRIGGFSIGTPDIPYLAKGGIVTKPTVAMIGEAGPEAVVPLSRMSQQPPVVVNFHGPVYGADSEALAKEVVTSLKRLKRARGGLELGIA